MKSFFTSSILILVASLFVGCEYFSTSTHTPQQIKQASQWSKEDQQPAFESCEDQAEEDRFDCFKNSISTAVYDALYVDQLVANQILDEEIVLVLEVDKTGEIALVEIENSGAVLDALPALSSVLESAIASLPAAIPAQKANVGVAVTAQLKLPIRVTASEE